MPSLNVKEYIDQTFKSVCEQTLQEIEIISVDAGSDDGTREIIQKWANRDNRIKIVDSEKKSYGYQVNLGLKIAQGEYATILETDDFVDLNMYEKIYKIAVVDKLDYVKSDYYVYWTMNNGKKLSFKRKIYSFNKIYDKIICPLDYYDNAVYDNYLWNGIYKLSFIQENNIKLNETPGAAYQDVGFIFQTHTKALRAKYIPQAYYHYCLDRTNSSTNSCKSIKYFQQEFEFLNPLIENENKRDVNFYYIRMARAFLFCCQHQMYTENADKSDIREKYDWFRKNLQDAVEKKLLQQNMLGIHLWNELHNLLNLTFEEAAQKKMTDIYSHIINAKNIVIFGCGYRGFCAYKYLKNIQKEPSVFLDNNSELWNTNIDNISIKAPQKYSDFPKDTVYLIANDSYYTEMKEQLINLGVEEDNICRFE